MQKMARGRAFSLACAYRDDLAAEGVAPVGGGRSHDRSRAHAITDYVGLRDALRFPSYARLEAGLERKVKILKLQPWIGVRVLNALDSFLPVDVPVQPRLDAFRHLLQLGVPADPHHSAVRMMKQRGARANVVGILRHAPRTPV